MRILRAAAILIIGALSLAAPAFSASTPDPTLAHLSALKGKAFDVAFMQNMIPMDDEAIEIVMTATLYADHPDLLHWNQRFVERQNVEIRHMLTWLQADGSRPTHRNAGVTTPSVKKIRSLRGAAMEKVFLPMMATHLDRSVAMARLGAKKASQPAVRSFAQSVVKADSQDASMLRGWLKKWYKSGY
jgi:uncharacterized protein (DUF305 family)